MKKLWRNMKKIWKKYEGNMKKYDGNMKEIYEEYEEKKPQPIRSKHFSRTLRGASSRSHGFQFRPITGFYKKFRPITSLFKNCWPITALRGKILTNHKFPWEIPTNHSPLLEIWRNMKELWRKYEEIMKKYERNIWTLPLDQSGASTFRTIQPELIRSQHFSSIFRTI